MAAGYAAKFCTRSTSTPYCFDVRNPRWPPNNGGILIKSIYRTTSVTLKSLLQVVKANLQNVEQEWKELQSLTSSAVLPYALSEEDVIVPKSALQKLAVEADQVKTLLPKVLNQNVIAASTKLHITEEELNQVKTERDGLQSEVLHWKTQLDTAVTESQKARREQLELRVDIQDLTSQLSQQSEFCSSLGAACCTLLWRVSRQEDCIQNIVSGSKSAEFLELISSSVDSYLTAYKDDQWPDQATDEATFILALCGTVTNIAASALGREHLASSPQGQAIINTFLTFIGEAPLGKSSNMKSLMLMSLYNISINQKGVKFLLSKSGLIQTLCWHLQEEKDVDNRVNTLRLLQSLISDDTCVRLIHEIKENLPMAMLQQLTTSPNKDTQDLALDLVMDIRRLESEQ